MNFYLKKILFIVAFVIAFAFVMFIAMQYLLWMRFANGTAIPENVINYYFAHVEKWNSNAPSSWPQESCFVVNYPIKEDQNFFLYGFPQGGIFIVKKSEALPTPADMNYEKYGHDVYGFFPLRKYIKQMETSFTIVILGIPSVLLLLLLFFYKRKWLLFIFFVVLGSPTFLFIPFLFYKTSYNHELFNAIKDNKDILLGLWNQNDDKFKVIPVEFLNKFRANYGYTSLLKKNLFPFGLQEKNIHQESIVIGSSSDHTIRYIRISDNYYNHLFYVPNGDITKLATINPDLSFSHLEGDFYLGRYVFAIKAFNFMKFIYILSLGLWLFIIFYCFTNLMVPFRKLFNRIEVME